MRCRQGAWGQPIYALLADAQGMSHHHSALECTILANQAGQHRRLTALRQRSVERSGAAANIERHYRVDLRGLDQDLDVDLLVARTDAPPARSYFYRRDMQLVVDVGVGPYAGAIRRFRFDNYAEQVPVDLFGTLDQRLDIFALMPE